MRVGVLVPCLLFAFGALAEAGMITVSSGRYGSLRDTTPPFGGSVAGDVFFADFLIADVFPTFPSEDRAAMEFSLAGVTEPVASARLILQITNNHGDTSQPLQYDVYAYGGDGVVNLAHKADFSAGTLPTGFVVGNAPVGSTVQIDVGSALNDRLAAHDSFAGFNIREHGDAPHASRYVWFSDFTGGDNAPSIAFTPAVPQPSSFVLSALGLVVCGRVLRSCRRRRTVGVADCAV